MSKETAKDVDAFKRIDRSVRASKTAAEERAVIRKECALIRTAFKNEHQMSGTVTFKRSLKSLSYFLIKFEILKFNIFER